MDDVYSLSTRSIRVSVKPRFSPENSNSDTFVYHYTITLLNEGADTVQLLMRHWIITDALGKEEQVIGEGVIGQKPVLAPGASFTYTSSCSLRTPTGSMKGRYSLRNSASETFDVAIPEFYLRDKRLMN